MLVRLFGVLAGICFLIGIAEWFASRIPIIGVYWAAGGSGSAFFLFGVLFLILGTVCLALRVEGEGRERRGSDI